MSELLPKIRPQRSRAEVEAIVSVHGLAQSPVVVVGMRGYYRDTMGKPGVNDIGMYDDAVFLVTGLVFKSFNANTDPSRGLVGMATLQPGVWPFAFGIHNRSKDPATHPHYPALIQAGPFTVFREGTSGYKRGDHHPVFGACLGNGRWSGSGFGINIHHGGYGTTSSAGCQTIYPDQWDDFINTVTREAQRCGLATIPYLLVNA